MSKQYIRKQYYTLKSRILEPRKFIQVLAGPRQVGKSTLAKQVIDSIELPYSMEAADNINPKDADWIHRVWESARVTMAIKGETERILVIDEIQKLDNWSEAVKKEWDYDTLNRINLKVVLLGSSRLLLKKGLTESLAGRFELIRMNHWSYSEMHEAFGISLDQYIYFGGYPGPAYMINDEHRWRKYIKDSLVAPAIEKDVIMTSNIYKPALMKQLFELGCGYSSEIVSLTKIIGQLQDAGNVTTLSSYLEILNQCALLTGLQKYANDDARKRNSVPKFQVYNNALLTAYKGRTFIADRTDTAIWGRWTESAIGSHILVSAEELDYQVFYWREAGKSNNDKDNEVDYIILRDGQLTAIEVKSGRRSMNMGLPDFAKKFSPKRSLIVGSGGISIEDFLQADIETIL